VLDSGSTSRCFVFGIAAIRGTGRAASVIKW